MSGSQHRRGGIADSSYKRQNFSINARPIVKKFGSSSEEIVSSPRGMPASERKEERDAERKFTKKNYHQKKTLAI